MSEQSLDYTNGDKYEVRLNYTDDVSLVVSKGFLFSKGPRIPPPLKRVGL